MRKIGVLTSGGDSPGMNPCIRAVVRKAIYEGLEVMGIKRGFRGLMEGDVEELHAHSVSGIIHQGGTILKTARAESFKTKEGQGRAVKTIKKLGIEGLIVIGGDGSLRGAYTLDRDWDIPVIGVPASIDNDIAGTDFSIGFLTAVNTALEAIDRIRDTATSHNRLFIIEVMGRSSGFIALWAGLAGGAEDILIPERKTDLDEVCRKLEEGRLRGKSSSILVVAEGDEAGGAFEIAKRIEKKIGYETRVVVLGHLQRGGSPVALDRILATKLGTSAVELLIKGERRKMVGLISNQIKASPIEYAWKEKKKVDLSFYDLSQVMAI
ncbi:6-phosphofructokinase [Candidatus Aerophobetes bacterium]|uniref:ATP-dependent 6-phosphofructokinase n=1 Tax=Aerophobetes bacterium TaxID=2030807 RepID=A0A497E3W4_UNCAE|nr:MAG: 6-phosphofructokinase [Candidatus Aerophobetes bacterium]